jgi:hypothetical protein
MVRSLGSPDIGAVAALVVISFCSYVAGGVPQMAGQGSGLHRSLDGSVWIIDGLIGC